MISAMLVVRDDTRRYMHTHMLHHHIIGLPVLGVTFPLTDIGRLLVELCLWDDLRKTPPVPTDADFALAALAISSEIMPLLLGQLMHLASYSFSSLGCRILALTVFELQQPGKECRGVGTCAGEFLLQSLETRKRLHRQGVWA